VVPGVGVGATLEEEGDHLGTAKRRREAERPDVVETLGVDERRIGGDKPLDRLKVARHLCLVNGGVGRRCRGGSRRRAGRRRALLRRGNDGGREHECGGQDARDH
jgi:hypothetical protein